MAAPDNSANASPMESKEHEGSPNSLHRFRSSKYWTMIVRTLIFILPIFIAIALLRSHHSPFNIVVAGPPSSSPECSAPPVDNCLFYANCLESRYQCGPTGYPLGYGKKFCEKFSENRSLFSQQGQNWLLNTMHCLQLKLVGEATSLNATTCEALEDYALGTHAGCYIDSGLCKLGVDDWEAILEVVDIKTVFQSWDTFKATAETGLDCGEYFAFMALKELF